MTATFVSFQVASRAMEASQAQINVTGNNISNVNTEGYTRQRVDVVSVTSSGMTEKYATPQVTTGLGAEATGTSQLRDTFLDTRYRNQNAETSTYNTMEASLTNLEDVFDEAETEALQGELASFINDLQSYSETPTSSDLAQVIRSSAQKITEYINMYANQIEEIREEQVEDLDIDVNSKFNTYVQNIASLNEQIRKEEIYGNTPNELYDQRNLLIDELSSIAEISVSSTPEEISEDLTISKLSISIKDPTTGENITIVDNDKYGTLSYEDDGDEITLSIEDTNNDTYADCNDYFTEGSIKGYLDIINGKGSFATGDESDVRGISYYAESMDIFAQEFASVLNDINALESDGTTVGTAAPLFTNSDGVSTDDITAKNIQISTEWLDDPTYIKTTVSEEETSSGSSDNILRMIEAMSDDQDFTYTPDGSTTESSAFTGSFTEYMTGLLGDLSTDVELYTNFSDTADEVLETIASSRDAVAGVSLNEEGVNLTAYQKVYNAAIRYFNVLDENLDMIINTMGV